MQSKFLKEIKSFIPVNTWMMIKQNSFMKKVLVFSIEYQTSYNIPLSRNLIHKKPKLSSILWRLKRVGKLEKDSLKLSEVGHEV